MVTRSSLSAKGPASVVSSVAPSSSANATLDGGAARPLLPGRRRLMREEDSSGTDSGGEEEDNAVSPPSVSCLHVSGSKRSTPGGQREAPSGHPKRVCVLSFWPAPAPSDSRIAVGSGASEPDVIYVRTERVSLSQTFLTSWLVRNV